MSNAKVTDQLVEVLYKSTVVANVRVTAQQVEVLGTSSIHPSARVTAQQVEVLKASSILPKVRVTAQQVEVLHKYFTYENNESHIGTGTVEFHGGSLTSDGRLFNVDSTGIILYEGSLIISASANILGIPEYSPTIQETVDLYHLTDNLNTFAVDYYPYHNSAISLDLVSLTLVTNNIRSTHTRALLVSDNQFDRTYLLDFYNRIHLTPENLTLGVLLSAQVYAVELWNSYFVSNTITATTSSGLTGVVVPLPGSLPITLKPLEDMVLNVTVNPMGLNYIQGTYSFTMSFETPVLTITGQGVKVWPFAALRDFTETREWLTDVLSARNGETRYALRDFARTTLDYDYYYTTMEEFATAKVMADNTVASPMAVPLWSDHVLLVNITAGTTRLYFDTTFMELIVGNSIILWKSYSDYEIALVNAITPTYIDLAQPLSSNHPRVFVLPLVSGYVDNGINFTENDNHVKKASISLQTVLSYTQAAWINDTYFLGYPVITTPLIASSGVNANVIRQVETVDSETGNIAKFDVENYTRQNRMFTLFAGNSKEIYQLRRLFDFLQGKYTIFWLPSFNQDIIPLENLLSGHTTLHVIQDIFSLYTPRYVRIVGSTTQMFEIYDISPVGDGTAYITFTTPASVDCLNITSIQIMKKVRLNSDSVKFAHSSYKVCNVQEPVIETNI